MALCPEIRDGTLFFFPSCHFQTLSSLYLIYTDSYNPTLFLHRKSCNSRPLLLSLFEPLFISHCPPLTHRCLLKSLLPPLSLLSLPPPPPPPKHQLYSSKRRRLPKLVNKLNQRLKPLQLLPLPPKRSTRSALPLVISRTSSSTR